jgi:hypothetical protein
VDKSSSDNTLQIVESKGVSFEVKEWQGFAETKKYAIGKVENDWVFWVDSDEVLTKELQEEIKNLKKSEPEFQVYKAARRAFFLGKWIKHGGWYPGRVARLFNKKIVSFNSNEVHEGLDYSCPAGELKFDLIHYTDESIKHYYHKFNNYTSLAAVDLEKKGRSFKAIDLIIHPIFLFVKMYIIRLGFLDGIQGFILAVFSANYVFTKYAKLWELNQKS